MSNFLLFLVFSSASSHSPAIHQDNGFGHHKDLVIFPSPISFFLGKDWKVVYTSGPLFLCLCGWLYKPALETSLKIGQPNTMEVRKCCLLSCVWLFATPCTVARQAPLSTEFSRQEYWSGLPFPSSWDLPDPGIESEFPASLALQADSLLSGPWGKLKIIWRQEWSQRNQSKGECYTYLVFAILEWLTVFVKTTTVLKVFFRIF